MEVYIHFKHKEKPHSSAPQKKINNNNNNNK